MWREFFESLSQQGRRGGLFVVVLLALLGLVALGGLLRAWFGQALQDSWLSVFTVWVMPGLLLLALIGVAAFFRRGPAQKPSAPAPLAQEEWRKARAKLVKPGGGS